MGKQIKPLDIAEVRRTLGLSRKELGALVGGIRNGCCGLPYLQSRVNEWERGTRSVPDVVYRNCATLIVMKWQKLRKAAEPNMVAEIDETFGDLLNPGFGKILKLRHSVYGHSSGEQNEIARSLNAICGDMGRSIVNNYNVLLPVT